jgi:hypothetical protein
VLELLARVIFSSFFLALLRRLWKPKNAWRRRWYAGTE